MVEVKRNVSSGLWIRERGGGRTESWRSDETELARYGGEKVEKVN